MEIEVGEYGLKNETEGMYARTNNGIIGKILNSNSDEMINGPELLVNNKIYCVERNSIKDIQENIIDLIEVGDIVHTRDVLNEDIVYIWSEEYLKACKEDLNNGIELVEILTKEQYKQNCYTVERNQEC